MFIYKIVNKINGDIYVGKTTKTLEERFRKHRHKHKNVNTHLYKAMRKYGVENFEIFAIEECTGNLNEREMHWIETLAPKYNMTLGGEGGDTSESPNFKEAMIRHHPNRTHYPGSRMLGKTHTEETKTKQSKRRTEYWENLSEEEREDRATKISGTNNGMFGKTPKNSLKVTYNGVEYPSLAAAVRDSGHSAKYIKKHGVIHNDRRE